MEEVQRTAVSQRTLWRTSLIACGLLLATTALLVIAAAVHRTFFSLNVFYLVVVFVYIIAMVIFPLWGVIGFVRHLLRKRVLVPLCMAPCCVLLWLAMGCVGYASLHGYTPLLILPSTLPDEPVYLPEAHFGKVLGYSSRMEPLVWIMTSPNAKETLEDLERLAPDTWCCSTAWRPYAVTWTHNGEHYTVVEPDGDGFYNAPSLGREAAQAFLDDLKPLFPQFRLEPEQAIVRLRPISQPGKYCLETSIREPVCLTLSTNPGGDILSDYKRKAIANGAEFTLYEGDWEEYYPVKVELHSTADELLFSRTYLLQGWQR